MGIANFFSNMFKNGEEGKTDDIVTPGDAEKSAEQSGEGSVQLPAHIAEAVGKASIEEINLVEEAPKDNEETEEEATVESDEPSPPLTEELVMKQLSGIYDPEIPIDIVNLGLIYTVEIEDGSVHVRMTMTAPGCPASTQISQESQYVIEEIQGVKDVWIEIVWDPPWDPSKMSEDARLSLGFG